MPKLCFAGGHYDNLGVLPLLRRRVDRITAIDADDTRNTAVLDNMMQRAWSDLGVTFSVPDDSQDWDRLARGRNLTHHINNFILPRLMVKTTNGSRPFFAN